MTAPLVSIICGTFNHESFISQAINSFLIQEADFEFEILIHDDASTDKTAEIVRNYERKFPSKIRAIYQSVNQYSLNKRVVPTVLQQCRGKYIALCEGDDYWTDPYKLQKQVDFLNKNPTASICWTRFFELYTDGFVYERPQDEICFVNGPTHKVTLKNVFDSPYPSYTLTTVFRRDVLGNINLCSYKYFKDNSLFVLALTKGDGYVLSDKTAMYRLHSGGSYSSLKYSDQLLQNFYNLTEIYQLIPAAKTKYFRNLIVRYILSYYKIEKQASNNLKGFSFPKTKEMLFQVPGSVKLEVLKHFLGSMSSKLFLKKQ